MVGLYGLDAVSGLNGLYRLDALDAVSGLNGLDRLNALDELDIVCSWRWKRDRDGLLCALCMFECCISDGANASSSVELMCVCIRINGSPSCVYLSLCYKTT